MEIDDVLGRLLALQNAAHPWLDDLAVRRNLAGVIVGAVDTTSKFVALAIDELLRRPEMLAGARECALKATLKESGATRGRPFASIRTIRFRYDIARRPHRLRRANRAAKKIPANSSRLPRDPFRDV